MQVRQGDVLLVLLAAADGEEGLVEQKAEESVVLEHGEATGHAHRVEASRVVLYYDRQAAQYLRVLEETPLTHEEHAAIMLREGLYRRAYQVEERREEVRRVAD